jgi:hypothetical protein
MDHLFHKNILQEKHNLEWQLAEANKKIEELQRTLSSLEEKKQTIPTWKPYKNAPGYPEPIYKDGRWYSPNPGPRPTELPKPRGMDDWRWGGQDDWERPGNEPGAQDPNPPTVG